MNPAVQNQLLGIARGGIWFAAGVTVGTGWVHGDTAIQIAGAVIMLIGGSWSGLANSNFSIIQAASKIPEVTRLDTSDEKLAQAARSADPTTQVVVVK